MIPNYTRPRKEIYQFLRTLPARAVDRRIPLLVGQQFALSRYGKEPVQGHLVFLPGGPGFEGTSIPLTIHTGSEFTPLPADHKVDEASLEVFLEDGRVNWWTIQETADGVDDDPSITTTVGAPDVISITGNPFLVTSAVSVPDALAASFLSRPLQVGDILTVEDVLGGGSPITRTVVELVDPTFDDELTLYHKARLSGPVVDASTYTEGDKLRVSAQIPVTMKLPSSTWNRTSSGVVLANGINPTLTGEGYTITSLPLVSGQGYVFASFRAVRRVTELDGVEIITDVNVSPIVGPNDLDNPLGYGTRVTLSSLFSDVTRKGLMVLRVEDDTVEAYEAALQKVQKGEDFYTITPLSERVDVQDAVATFVGQSSSAQALKWKKAYIGIDSPGEQTLLTDKAATFSAIGSTFTRVVFTDNTLDLTTLELRAGDLIRYTVSSTLHEFSISSVISATELILKTGPLAAPGSVNVTVVKPATPDNVGDYIIARASQFNTRRISPVWSDRPTRILDDGRTVIPTMYLACDIAGLRCALPPHQGLTNFELTSASAAASMYMRFSDQLLDKIASNGVMIVTQDQANSPVIIRHQLTSQTDKGALYYEDSVTSNVDDISYELRNLFRGRGGKQNVGPTLLRDLRNDVVNLLNDKLLTRRGDVLGPQLLGWEDLEIFVDPQVADRVVIKVRLLVPLPFNYLTVELEVDQLVSQLAA